MMMPNGALGARADSRIGTVPTAADRELPVN